MAENFKAVVELFPQEGGWHFVRVPVHQSEPYLHLANRGLIAVDATVGTSQWKTSLLPMGDQTHFLALPAKVRKAESIKLGDRISATFTVLL